MRPDCVKKGCIAAPLVLDAEAAEEDEAGDEKVFPRACGLAEDVAALVVRAAEDRHDLQDHVPVLGHAKLAAAAEAEDVDHSAIARHFRVADVQVEPAEDGVRLPALEVGGDDAALAAAEDRPLVQGAAGVRGRIPCPRTRALREDDAQAYEHENERKEVAQPEVKEAERAQEKERAQRDENRSGKERPAGELRKADRDEDERPEPPEIADVHEAEVVEREEKARGDERKADDEPGQGVVARAGVHGDFPRVKDTSRGPVHPSRFGESTFGAGERREKRQESRGTSYRAAAAAGRRAPSGSYPRFGESQRSASSSVQSFRAA